MHNLSAILLAIFGIAISTGCSSSNRSGADTAEAPALSWRGSRNAATDLAMVKLSKSHDQYCKEIASVLGVPETEIPPHTRVIVRRHLRAAGMAFGHRIWLHHGIAAGHDIEELRGLYIHELTHTFQNYNLLSKPTWLVEGIADYARIKMAPDSKWTRRSKLNLLVGINVEPREIHFTDGYFTATALLLHIENHYDPKFVQSVHQQLLAGRYSETFFEDRTGKTPEELWEELTARTSLKTVPSGGMIHFQLSPSAR